VGRHVRQTFLRRTAFPHGLANSLGFVGDTGKDFSGGFSYMSGGPLPAGWAGVQNGRGFWGDALAGETDKYNHQAGLKIIGETLPQERNRVTLADEKDQYR
jgi:hypothetical protein